MGQGLYHPPARVDRQRPFQPLACFSRASLVISSVTFHPFISHFPTALFVAGLLLLYLARKRNRPVLAAAGSLNFSIGFLAVLMAAFSGMVSVDVGLRTTVEVQGHQGYSFLAAILYGFCMVYSYIRAYSPTAILFYALNLAALGASVYSGYLLVFYSNG